jgi:hypothetical protein
MAQLADLPGTQFYQIKAHEPERDGGYQFLHGVALAWHNGRLYASWGHNRGKENTGTEEARGRVSSDGGKTWGEVFTIDAGDRAQDLAVSHGVFHERGGKLWAFQAAFTGSRQNVHTRAYELDDRTGKWTFRGVAVCGGFWPMQEPQRLTNGRWIMAGIRVGEGDPAAVAIGEADDPLKWELVVIPGPEGRKMWGESAVIVDGVRVLNIARFGAEPKALVAESRDYGRTWTPSQPSNLPMSTAKPYAGVLTTGEYYLINTIASDAGAKRAPLSIAVSRPGEMEFCRIFRIRGAELPHAAVESNPRGRLPYPYAVEHDGLLYVGYSNSGGRNGMNINSAELAVIPLSALRGMPARR